MALMKTSLLVLMALSSISMHVEALQCHRCLYVDPYDDTAKFIINLVNTGLEAIGRKYEYSDSCENNPADGNLVTAAPIRSTTFVANTLTMALKLIEAQAVTQNRTADASRINKVVESLQNAKSVPQNVAIKANVAMCLTAELDFAYDKLAASVIVRDGVVDTTDTFTQDDCSSIDDLYKILLDKGLINQDDVDFIKQYIKVATICSCSTEKCNDATSMSASLVSILLAFMVLRQF